MLNEPAARARVSPLLAPRARLSVPPFTPKHHRTASEKQPPGVVTLDGPCQRSWPCSPDAPPPPSGPGPLNPPQQGSPMADSPPDARGATRLPALRRGVCLCPGLPPPPATAPGERFVIRTGSTTPGLLTALLAEAFVEDGIEV